jgi:uncharacterized protein YbbC (DUF1343 family)
LGGLLDRPATEAGATSFRVIPHNPPSAGAPPGDWVAPSPALDQPESVAFYPGLVLLEGTNLCEGRGTPVPFRSVGAPWLDSAALAADIARWCLPVSVRDGFLKPSVGRYAGATIRALTFKLSDRGAFDGFAFGVRLLCAIAARHDEFAWTQVAASDPAMPEAPDRYTIDALLGDRGLRMAIARGDDADAILELWHRD